MKLNSGLPATLTMQFQPPCSNLVLPEGCISQSKMSFEQDAAKSASSELTAGQDGKSSTQVTGSCKKAIDTTS